MTIQVTFSTGKLAVQVDEASPGLYFWVVRHVSIGDDVRTDECIGISDHPYPSYEAAMSVGMACLKAYEAAAANSGNKKFIHDSNLLPLSSTVGLY